MSADSAEAAYGRVLDGMVRCEDRPGQRQMVRAVAQAFEAGRHLLIEAGTGTGKSIAYLVPAIDSGEQTVVSTATKALQGQLVGKDLPLVSEGFDGEVSWALVKGRSNYVCLAKTGELGGFLEPGLKKLVSWSLASETGDLDEYPERIELGTRLAATARPEECPGAMTCSVGAACFAERARLAAISADVVVANHHLLLADMKLRAVGAGLLPEVSQVVVDEAHRFEEAAVNSFGVELTERRFTYATRLAASILPVAGEVEGVDSAARRLFAALPEEKAAALDARVAAELAAPIAVLSERLVEMAKEVRAIADEEETRGRKTRLERVLSALGNDLGRVVSPTADEVVWTESSGGGVRLCLAPLDVAPLVASMLLSRATTVFTSATLISTGGFERVARTLGLRSGVVEIEEGGQDAGEWDELDVESPFDFESSGLLYLSTGLPSPQSPEFAAAARGVILELVEAAGGGALCLFTSWRAMEQAHEALAAKLAFEVLKQGEAPPERLIARFVESAPAVLFATQTFWQGVDVAGDALRLVVIDRIPFAPPDDPLYAARAARIEEGGGSSFYEEALPRAGLLLKQGVGRLIRSMEDRGVVAILDGRMLTSRYGAGLVECLPPMTRTTRIDDVREFFAAG